MINQEPLVALGERLLDWNVSIAILKSIDTVMASVDCVLTGKQGHGICIAHLLRPLLNTVHSNKSEA